MNYLGFAAAAVGVPVFFAVERVLRASSLGRQQGTLALLTAFAIPSLLFAVYYLHVLPESEWLYALRSLTGSEFLVLFFAGATGALASFLPRLLIGFALFGYLLLASVPYLKPVFAPLDEAMLVDRWKGDACLQSTASTCGPACIATLLKRAGVTATEREIARAAFTSAGGTEAWYLARYVRALPVRHGMLASFFVRDGFSPDLGLPAMVGVRVGGAGHFIAVLEREADMITFADPIHGMERLPLDRFGKRYVFTGFHMVVAKD